MGYYSKLGRQNKKCSSNDADCYDQYEECMNNQNAACDCCCVQGIKDELSTLRNQTVRIDTQTRSYVGVVNAVTCDVVRLGPSVGTIATIISICKIEAIVPATVTPVVTAEFNLDDVANKA
ncbi:hypothetical protein NPM06_31395 [Bacillus cereus]|uniref:hypothetical protein n=1 Tax=Bacillus cereus TaxID=1396 RepID=UPI0021120B11|nr:hypothetical protein [Bacillus cereus]